MAIFHVRMQVIGRSSGRSVVAAAAYRAAQLLHDVRQGRDHDFTAKTGVVHSEILLPEGAPERWQDRATLWNEVEAAEKRRDAQLAREMEFSIPRELSQAEAIRLARDFVSEQFVSRGMVADVNVHWTTAKDGEAQPHAHVMLTMREVTADGFGPKARAWNSRELYDGVRERWATLANERLCEQGHDVRIDHRSYAEQGIALEPQNKIGPAGARREARGEDAERAAEHDALARRNGERIAADPAIALDALTRQQSTFTRHDLARFVSRHTDGAEQFASVLAVVEASADVVRLGQDGRGRDRFTTREMLAVEQRLETAAVALSERRTHQVALARRVADTGLGGEQRLALGHVTRARDLAVVVGFAGTGKSTMLGVARQLWEAEGYTVRGAALSGIAAEGLEAGAGIGSRTLASLEHGWARGRDVLGSRDVLVVDEAGMIGSRQLERVLSAAQAAGAKVVLVGDPEQLQAIEAGAAFRAVAERVGAVEITAVRRQREGWQQEATRELATGRTAAALGRYEAAGMVQGHDTLEAARAGVVAAWEAARRQKPEASQIMLAHQRVDVRALNERARDLRRQAGELGEDHALSTGRGERCFAEGDRLYFLKNERSLGVKNGTLGTVERISGQGAGASLAVRLDGPAGAGSGRTVRFELRDYAEIDHGYAGTVHKSQGVTVDRAHVLATRGMDRHAAYAGLSRHRDGVSLHWSRDEMGSRAGLDARLGREGLKDTSLDYDRRGSTRGREPGTPGTTDLTRPYAERRGFDPLHPVSEIVVRTPEPAPERPPERAPPAKTPRHFPEEIFGKVREPGRVTRPPPAALPSLSPKEPSPLPPEQPAERTPAEALAQTVAAGRARFRERFEAHQRQQAQARDEAAARELVAQWDRLLPAYRAALPKLEADPAFSVRREQLAQFGCGVREQPGAARVLREQGEAFGMAERPNLARIVADRDPERVVAGIMTKAEDETRAQLRAAADLEAARQRQLQARRAPRLDRDRGPSMGW